MNLIIQKLRKSPSTFNEILGYLIHHSGVSGEDYNISLRTFQRDLQYPTGMLFLWNNTALQYKVYFKPKEENPRIFLFFYTILWKCLF